MSLGGSSDHPIQHGPDVCPRGRRHGRDELLADFLVHVIGTIAALAGAIAVVFIAGSRNWAALAPVGVYAGALVTMFGASAAYNLAYETRFRSILRRLDHSAIFLMIAGTYTPFTTRLVEGRAAVWSTVLIWSMALGGILLKLTKPRLFERVGVVIYLALGWSAVAIYAPIASMLKGWPLAMLIAGGGLYTIGVCFHMRERLRFHNAIWHLFVLIAASCQYATVLTAVAMR